jgi:hypothetical protein
VRVVDGGNVILDGYDAARPLRMAWDDVYFDKPDAIKVKASHAAIAKGPGPSNLPITGENVTLTGTTSDAPRLDCERKFVPLPANAARLPIGGGDYAAVVDARFSGTDGAMVDGALTYRTIGSALTSLPANGRRAGDRLHSERPLSREAHDRQAARDAARRVARRRRTHVRRRVRHADRQRAAPTARAAATRSGSSPRIFAPRT